MPESMFDWCVDCPPDWPGQGLPDFTQADIRRGVALRCSCCSRIVPPEDIVAVGRCRTCVGQAS